MNRSHNRKAAPVSTESVLSKKNTGGRLLCRGCNEYTDQSLSRRGGSRGCPKCGGILDRVQPPPVVEPNQVEQGIAATLLAAIAAEVLAGKTLYAIAKDAGIPQSAILRFASGERGISLETADKLCRLLGLRLMAA